MTPVGTQIRMPIQAKELPASSNNWQQTSRNTATRQTNSNYNDFFIARSIFPPPSQLSNHDRFSSRIQEEQFRARGNPPSSAQRNERVAALLQIAINIAESSDDEDDDQDMDFYGSLWEDDDFSHANSPRRQC